MQLHIDQLVLVGQLVNRREVRGDLRKRGRDDIGCNKEMSLEGLIFSSLDQRILKCLSRNQFNQEVKKYQQSVDGQRDKRSETHETPTEWLNKRYQRLEREARDGSEGNDNMRLPLSVQSSPCDIKHLSKSKERKCSQPSKLWSNKKSIKKLVKFSMQNDLLDMSKFSHDQTQKLRWVVECRYPSYTLSNPIESQTGTRNLESKRQQLFLKQIKEIQRFHRNLLNLNCANIMNEEMNQVRREVNQQQRKGREREKQALGELKKKISKVESKSIEIEEECESLKGRYRDLLKQGARLDQELMSIEIEQQMARQVGVSDLRVEARMATPVPFEQIQGCTKMLEQKMRLKADRIKKQITHIGIIKQTRLEEIKHLKSHLLSIQQQPGESKAQQSNSSKNILQDIKDEDKRVRTLYSRLLNKISYFDEIKDTVPETISSYLQSLTTLLQQPNTHPPSKTIKQRLEGISKMQAQVLFRSYHQSNKQDFNIFCSLWQENKKLQRPINNRPIRKANNRQQMFSKQ